MTMRKKNRQNRPKSGISSLVLSVGAACCVGLSILVRVPTSRAVVPESEPFSSCGHPPQIALPLSELYQNVPVQQPGVVCAFRHKIKGFPAITVIQEPLGRPRTIDQKARDIESSYHLVGLTDAVVLEPRLKNISGFEALEAQVKYTSQGAPMQAFLAMFEVSDRTYTVTALFRAEEAPEEKNDIIGRIERLHVDSDGPIQTASRPPTDFRAYLILGVVVILLVAVIARRKLRMTRS